MKTWVLVLLCWFSLSGCIVVDSAGKRKGPPWWAPAHGYRRKHTTIIITTPHQYKAKKPGNGRGHGKWKK